MKLGDFCWVAFPGGQGALKRVPGCRSQRDAIAAALRHPAIVFQTAELPTALPTALMIPLTTQHAALKFPGTALVEADSRNKLTKASVALVLQMLAGFIGPPTGVLSQPVLHSLQLSFGVHSRLTLNPTGNPDTNSS